MADSAIVIPETKFKGAGVASKSERDRAAAAATRPMRARTSATRRTSAMDWTENPAPQPLIYHLAVQRAEEGQPVTAYCVELPGAVTEGDSAEEACSQLRDAIEALIDEYRASGQPVPWVAREIDEGFVVAGTLAVNG